MSRASGVRRFLRRRGARIALLTGLFLGAMGAGAAYATFSATTTNSVTLSAAGDLKGSGARRTPCPVPDFVPRHESQSLLQALRS